MEGHLGSLSDSPVVQLPPHLGPEAQSMIQAVIVLVVCCFSKAVVPHFIAVLNYQVCLGLLGLYEPGVCMQVPNVEPVKLVISGPSGVGKDAIVKALQTARPDLHFVITATSR